MNKLQTKKNTTDLSVGNVKKLLFKLAIPSVIAQLVNALYNIIDRIYIGHIPEIGKAALTGVGVTVPIIMVIVAFSALLATGSASRASIMLGGGKKDTAEKIVGNSFALIFYISILITLIVSIFGKKLLMIFGASSDTIIYAWPYLQIYIYGTFFVLVSIGMNLFISCQGFAKISMLTVIIGAIINIVLDPFFIFVMNMGVRGAALATIISQGISATWVIIFLTSKKTTIKIKIKNLKLNAKIILPCVALGLSPFIMQATESAINICFNTSMKLYGGDIAVGTMGILSSLMLFMMMPLFGFAHAAQPLIGYNYGAKKPERCKEAFRTLLITSFLYSMIIAIALRLFPEIFVKIFNDDPSLVQKTVWAIPIFFAGTLIFGIQIACQNCFIAIGNAKTSLFVAVLRKIILLIPLIYILPIFLEDKVYAILLAEPIADYISVLVVSILFFSRFKQAMEKIS